VAMYSYLRACRNVNTLSRGGGGGRELMTNLLRLIERKVEVLSIPLQLSKEGGGKERTAWRFSKQKRGGVNVSPLR